MLDAAVLFVELVGLLLVVSTGLALLARCVGLARMQRWLGGTRLSGGAKGMALGFVIPFCTYSAVPLFAGMVGARVRVATMTGFLLAAPVLDPLVVAVLALLFGWRATLAYALVTAAVVLALALVADALGAHRLLRPAGRPLSVGATDGEDPTPTDGGCAPDPVTDARPWRGWRDEGRTAARYAAGLVRRLAGPMLLAVGVAALIAGVVPDQLLARLAGPDDPLAVPAAALLGAPFYVSTEAFLPVAAALYANGMALGATFALVVSAAGVNVPELALLGRFMRPALLAAYTATVVGVAIVAGYLVPVVL